MAEDNDRVFLTSYMEERFGIPASVFRNCIFFEHRQSWWVVRNASHASLPQRLKVSMVGLKAFQKVGAFVKPTTRLIQTLGARATRSKIDLTESELKTLLRDGDLDLVSSDVGEGYIILCLGPYVLGLGLFVQGRLKSQIPKKHLKFYEA